MTKAWLPPKVARELTDSTNEYRAEVARDVLMAETWTRELRQIDPYLCLVRAREDARTLGLRPGFFHLVRNNPGAPPLIVVWENPDGSFREPDSGIFEYLRKADFQSERTVKAQRRASQKLQEAEKRQKDRERRELHEEAAERWKAANRLQVRI